MKSFINVLFMSMLGLGLISTLDSCKKVEGCTDADSENFNPDADVDDGSCVYARDQFIGTFMGLLGCEPPFPTDEPFSMVITESLSSNSEVLINFQDLDDLAFPELTAKVSGDVITIEPEIVQVPLDANNPELLTEVRYSGEATISGDNLNGTLSFTIIILNETVDCAIVATRQ